MDKASANLPDRQDTMNRKEAVYLFIKKMFRSMSLRTQMLLILLFLLLISIGSLTVLYSRSEEQLIDKLTDNIDDITKAIQISVEELTLQGRQYGKTEKLCKYAE